LPIPWLRTTRYEFGEPQHRSVWFRARHIQLASGSLEEGASLPVVQICKGGAGREIRGCAIEHIQCSGHARFLLSKNDEPRSVNCAIGARLGSVSVVAFVIDPAMDDVLIMLSALVVLGRLGQGL